MTLRNARCNDKDRVHPTEVTLFYFFKLRNKQTIQRPRLGVSGLAESSNLIQGMSISACIAGHRAGPRLVGTTGAGANTFGLLQTEIL